jgi:hypothetical protein
MAGRLVSEFAAYDHAGAGWRERLYALAHGVRAVAKRHPAVFPLLLERPSVTPDAIRVIDIVFQALLDAGVPPAHVPRIERLLSTFLLGFGVSEVRGRFSAGSNETRVRRADPDQEPALDQLPAHRRLAPVLAEPIDWDAEFEADLEDLAAVIESVIARPGPRIASPVAHEDSGEALKSCP